MGSRPDIRRDPAVDLSKVLAICAVVFIHCTAAHLVNHPPDSLSWLAACFYGSVSRWAVAVFVLCSGAVMNRPERELSMEKLFSRYLLRLALTLSVWAALYELLIAFINRGSVPLDQLLFQGVKNWLTGNTYYHLYYFYYAFALYLLLPLTRLIAKHASRRELRYILALWLLSGGVLAYVRSLPPFNRLTTFVLQFSIYPVILVPGLGLLGWYLHRYPPKGRAGGLALFLAGFGVTFFATWQRSAAAGKADLFFLSGFTPFVLLMAAGVFRLCQSWPGPAGPRGERWLAFLSKGSFCVFLIHPFFQWLTRQTLFEALPPVWAIPVQVLLLLTLSYGTYAVLRRIPVVNRWLI